MADVAYTIEEIWRRLPCFPIDVAIAYEKLGVQLGNEIVFSAEGEPRVVLATGRYKGERGISLVALGIHSADFKKDGDAITLDISEDRLVPVPISQDPDNINRPQTHDPRGRAEEAEIIRFLHRMNSSAYVGLPVRINNNAFRLNVVAGIRASCLLGVVAEVPDGDVTKIQDVIDRPEPPSTATKKD